MPQFEFDSAKSELNRQKHGIDFVEAQEIWKDDERLYTDASGRTEDRLQVLGRARGKLWAAFITYREDAVRIISIRRARIEERRRYEEGSKE
jgi:uncharacterized DUF497 family protein